MRSIHKKQRPPETSPASRIRFGGHVRLHSTQDDQWVGGGGAVTRCVQRVSRGVNRAIHVGVLERTRIVSMTSTSPFVVYTSEEGVRVISSEVSGTVHRAAQRYDRAKQHQQLHWRAKTVTRTPRKNG